MRRRAKNISLAAKSVALATAVPQVVGYRVFHMAKASGSARDRREFDRMIVEKPWAFAEAWNAMALEAMRVNQSLFMAIWSSFLNPLSAPRRTAAVVRDTPLRLLEKGLEPIRRTAVLNAKRLSRSRSR